MNASSGPVTELPRRMAQVATLAIRAAGRPEVGAWARRVVAAAAAECATSRDWRACHAPTEEAQALAVAEACRGRFRRHGIRGIAYVNEAPETLVSPEVLLELGAGDCDDSTALVLAALLRLGLPSSRLAVRAGLVTHNGPPYWHIWAAYDSPGGLLDLDGSTTAVDPGGRSPVEAGRLREVLMYRLPESDYPTFAAAGALGDVIDVGKFAGDLLEDLTSEVASFFESLLYPNTVKYAKARALYRTRIAEWLEAATDQLLAAEDLPTCQQSLQPAPGGGYQPIPGSKGCGVAWETAMATAAAYQSAVQQLLKSQAFKDRLGDPWSKPPSAAALTPPDGGVSAVALKNAYLAFNKAYVAESQRRSAELSGQVRRGLPTPTRRGPPALTRRPGTAPTGGGTVGGIVPAIGLAGLAFLLLGAGGLPAAGLVVGSQVLRRPGGACGCKATRAPAGAGPGLPAVLVAEEIFEWLVGEIAGSSGDVEDLDQEEQDEVAIWQAQADFQMVQALLSMFPGEPRLPPNHMPDPDAARTRTRLQGYGSLGVLPAVDLLVMLLVFDRFPMTLRRLAKFPLSAAQEFARQHEREFMGPAPRNFFDSAQSTVDAWLAQQAVYLRGPEAAVIAELEARTEPLSPAAQEALGELVTLTKRRGGDGGGLVPLFVLAIAALLFGG